MKMTQLVWYLWQDRVNSIADRVLPIRDDAMNRHGKCLLYLTQKDSKVGLTRDSAGSGPEAPLLKGNRVAPIKLHAPHLAVTHQGREEHALAS